MRPGAVPHLGAAAGGHSLPLRHLRGFCPSCGTSLSYQRDDLRDEIDITAATLDDPEAVKPQDHIWWKSHVSWVVPGDGLRQLPGSHYEHGYPKS